MRHILTVSGLLLVALLLYKPFATAQDDDGDSEHRPGLEIPLITPGPGWKTCPRCENGAHVADDTKRYNVAGHAFDPHDISGVWGASQRGSLDAEGVFVDQSKVVFTPYGQKLYDATKSDVSDKGLTISNSKDPEMICDPMGYPRNLAYNYGFEFVQTPDRVFQFFEWGHTWRTIWTDGRPLPTDPPVQRYMGYAVGKWEGDEFVIHSNGFDPRSWISQDRKLREYGYPHTADMQLEERYKRVNYGTLQVTLTITDPKIYAKPWTTMGSATLRPGTEIGEYFCVPSESIKFNQRQTAAAAGAKQF